MRGIRFCTEFTSPFGNLFPVQGFQPGLQRTQQCLGNEQGGEQGAEHGVGESGNHPEQLAERSDVFLGVRHEWAEVFEKTQNFDNEKYPALREAGENHEVEDNDGPPRINTGFGVLKKVTE